MENLEKAVVEFVVREVVSNGFRHLAWSAVLLFAMIFLGRRWRQMRSDIESLKSRQTESSSSQIILQPGATYNDFRGANGEWHLRTDGPVEFIAPEPVPVRFRFSVAEPKVTHTQKDDGKEDPDETDA